MGVAITTQWPGNFKTGHFQRNAKGLLTVCPKEQVLTSVMAVELQGHQTASRWEATTSEDSRPGWHRTAELPPATAEGAKAQQGTGAVRGRVLKSTEGQCYGESKCLWGL